MSDHEGMAHLGWRKPGVPGQMPAAHRLRSERRRCQGARRAEV